jgi:hypothetical protein
MSELKVDKVSPRSGNYVALNTVGMKNIIINGDMSIAQRGTSEASITSSGYYTADRFLLDVSNMGTWTNSQSTDVPTGQGFATSFKLDCTTADAAPAAGDFLIFTQKFEGQNLQYLKKGTANAQSLTLSFWVKSSKTGTYIAELKDQDNSRNISKSYTIDIADTWEKKTITYAGDTTGTLDNDNAASLQLFFWLGAGSTYTSGTLQTSWGSQVNANRAVGQVNLADDTANEWYITGVQLEAGTTASDFEFLPVDVNLQRCYRYCYRINGNAVDETNIGGVGYTGSSTSRINLVVEFHPPLRAVPSVSSSSDLIDEVSTATGLSLGGLINNDQVGICNTLQIAIDDAGAFTAQRVGRIALDNSTSSFVEYDSEL